MTGWVAMVPATLRSGAAACSKVAGQARAVAADVGGLPQPEGLPIEAIEQIAAAAVQLRTSATAADSQARWLVHRAQRGALADGPFGSPYDFTEPPLPSPWATPEPEEPLKVRNPGASGLQRLRGKDWVLPEDAVDELEMGAGGLLKQVPKILGIGARKVGRSRTNLAPGGGLKAHEGAGRGHTIQRHVGRNMADLRQRLAANPWMKSASTFSNRALAEDAVAGVIARNQRLIKTFLPKDGKVVIQQEFNRPVGRILAQDGTISATRKVTVVLVKDNSKLGYHVKTAYPSK